MHLSGQQQAKLLDTIMEIANLEVRGREQAIIDICFQVAISVYQNPHFFTDREQLTAWVRKQLTDCGFPVEACGSSHGVLVDENPIDEKKLSYPPKAGDKIMCSTRGDYGQIAYIVNDKIFATFEPCKYAYYVHINKCILSNDKTFWVFSEISAQLD